MLRIPLEEVEQRLAGVLRGLGFGAERAELCVRLFAETTCDGVYSHGVDRFARFVAMVANGTWFRPMPMVVAGLARWSGGTGIAGPAI